MVTIQKTINALSHVVNPASTKNIVEEGMVRNISVEEGKVSFELVMQSKFASISHEIRIRAEEAVRSIEGVSQIACNVIQSPAPQSHSRPQIQSPLNKVKNVIAISSAKGGVGKSTIAAQTALELSRNGLKVGLVDADIFGPSVPTLFPLKDTKVYSNDKNQLLPLEYEQLKLMSFGYLLGDKPAVMRGPIVTRYIQQILLNTDWGELDYLFIDMPPGTGDVQLTITQSIRLTGAVIITTPHTLSLIDVARGIIMFEKVEVPIIGLIENMSFLETPEGEKHYIFGQPSSEKLANRFGVEILGEVPILESLSKGVSQAKVSDVISQAVQKMVKSTQAIKANTQSVPNITFDQEKVEFAWENGELWKVKNFDLRMISQDALSVNEMTGEQIIKAEDIKQDIAAKEVTPLGHYGVGVAWNDGHSSAIYTYKNIRQIALISS